MADISTDQLAKRIDSLAEQVERGFKEQASSFADLKKDVLGVKNDVLTGFSQAFSKLENLDGERLVMIHSLGNHREQLDTHEKDISVIKKQLKLQS